VSNETETWYKECWDKYHPMVLRRCREILRNTEDAEDAAQDVFTKFYEKEGSFDIRPEGFGGLLSKMAVNKSLNQYRKNRMVACQFYALATNVSLNRVRGMGTGDIYDKLSSTKVESDGFPDDSEQVINSLFVKAILEEEDEKTRGIYYMYYRDRMPLKEIGELVGLSTAAVHKRLKKLENTARSKLGKDQNNGKK